MRSTGTPYLSAGVTTNGLTGLPGYFAVSLTYEQQGELVLRNAKAQGVANPVIAQDMMRVIDMWQSATGQGVKDLAVRVRQSPTAGLPLRPTPQPTRLPSAVLPVSAGQAGPEPCSARGRV